MIRKAIGVFGAAILVAGLLGAAARAQQTPSDGQTPAAVIKPVPALHQPKPITIRKAEEKSAPAETASLDYPPCSKTVKDRCIQLWQPNLAKTYPQCAKVKGSTARAACIESAYQQDKK
jgi:hypothetical protein